MLDCLVGHHAFQGQCVKGGGDRAHWQGELDARRVAIVSDVLARLPTGGDVPERWWATPASLDERVPRDSRLRVRRHVHEPCVHAEAPVVLTEDERVVIVDKPPGLPTLAGVGPGVAGENNAVAVLRRLRASASASAKRKREESDDGGGGGGRNRRREAASRCTRSSTSSRSTESDTSRALRDCPRSRPPRLSARARTTGSSRRARWIPCATRRVDRRDLLCVLNSGVAELTFDDSSTPRRARHGPERGLRVDLDPPKERLPSRRIPPVDPRPLSGPVARSNHCLL